MRDGYGFDAQTEDGKKQAVNPYLPGYEYVPDGEPRVFGDRVYIFGSHDTFGGSNFCTGDYVCWSAPVHSLGDWSYEGVIYSRLQDPLNAGGKMYMCAPDVQKGPDGRYYLYYEYDRAVITSVAVCDTPAGKYEFYGYVRRPDGTAYGSLAGDVNNFDPGIFVDDNGRIYLYTGFAPGDGWMKKVMQLRGRRIDGAYCIELESDMLTMKTEPRLIAPGADLAAGTSFREHPFFEASSMRKINGRYYYVYSSVLSHELCYAISDRPDEGFVFGGTLISIGDLGLHGNRIPVNYLGNTHGGMAEILGQWYIFYHRQTNKQKCARQGCAEKLTIREDGSIEQAEMTSCGLNPGPLIAKGTYEARIACNLGYKEPAFAYLKVREKDKKHPFFTQSGTDREDNPDQYIANMRDGAWAGCKYFSFEGETRISVKIRGKAKGVLEISTARNGAPVAALPVRVEETEAWQSVSGAMEKLTGTYALFFRYCGNGAIDFKEFTIG